MAALFIAFSALITAFNNFLIRQGIDGTKGDPFIVHRFCIAALISLPIIYMQHGVIAADPYMSLVGVAAGLALGLLQYAIGRCLQYGPAALSFIFISSVCVVPPVIMFFLFGEEFGHGYTFSHLMGALLVIIGLYWMGKTQKLEESLGLKKWYLWLGIAFAGGILYQLILQWRALLLNDTLPDTWLLPFRIRDAKGDIFIPITFLVAALSQIVLLKTSQNNNESSSYSKKQIFICGIIGGVLSSISTFLLIFGTESAITDTEKAIIFPLNTVLIISLCNCWAKLFYKEKVNWPANALSVSGIIIST